MIIANPNDGSGQLYHVVNLSGQTVHAYRCGQAALKSIEGDQRIFTQEDSGKWIGQAPFSLIEAAEFA